MIELVSLGQLARKLGVTQNWLRQEADAGRLPCLRADKRYLFDLETAKEALARRAGREEVRHD
jgi:hypothetical protein